ncbi:hypothetical protein ABE82_26150 (plasmid) [Paenibacillus peoriae]|uniref:VWA domain-containing protein n=1 Tax=Paenibacillus peoriae TaxID=59893 RepID=UPI00071F1239|nr:VWA domain-containing protein [Paenibacillus peoriae]ALS09904.1 hypothetical protein ABE82_26150 [Paenibacillus peoriae]
MSIDLAKKHLIDLSKKANDVISKSGLGGQKAKVIAVFDVSGSMYDRYRSGEVQEAADRVLALAMQFDDDQELDVFAFDSDGHSIGVVSEQNFYQFVDKKVAQLVGGATSYAPVMNLILKSCGIKITEHNPVKPQKKGFMDRLFGKKEELQPESEQSNVSSAPLNEPIFVAFFTDGENSAHDYAATERVLIESSKHGVFWKFIGIGNEKFKFLNKLDNLKGRLIDNAHFIEVKNLKNISEEELYNKLLNEYPEWLSAARANKLIK